MKKTIVPTFLAWLPVATAIVTVYMVLYLITGHNIRQGFTETLVQYAGDTKTKILAGIPINEAMKKFETVDIQRSLSPFVIIYDVAGKGVAGTGTLNGTLPTPPKGVFEYAKKRGEHRLTWQPQRGVRNDIVVVPYKQGYILAGHPLRETEARKYKVTAVLFAGMAFTLLASFIVTFVIQWIIIKRPQYAY